MDGTVPANWQALAEEVWLGVAEWRAAHPRATFVEIERAVDERLAVVRTRVLRDVALASSSTHLGPRETEERARCPQCDGELEGRGQQTRELATLRGDVVSLKRSYAVCQSCGQGLFPPR